MSESVVVEEPKKKSGTSRSRSKKKEAAERALEAFEQDKKELGEEAAKIAAALSKELAALDKAEKEQAELERKRELKTEEVAEHTSTVDKLRADLARVVDIKFGARSTQAKAYRGK